MEFPRSDMSIATDQVLLAPYAENQPVSEKLHHLNQASRHLGELVMGAVNCNEHLDSIKGATTLVTIPSLSKLAAGKTSDLNTAERVSREYKYLAEFVLQNRLCNKDEGALTGQLSETAILGLLWWGISKGYSKQESWARPATYTEDQGSYGGLRDGIDILYRDHSLGKTPTRIQVKTRPHSSANRYDPCVRVIAATAVADIKSVHKAQRALYNGLAYGHCEVFWQRTISSLHK